MFFARTYIVVLLLVLCGSVLSAQNQLDSIQHLQEVEVVARLQKEIIPAQKLSGKELEAFGVLSVADAVRYFAGVQIKDYGGIGGLKTVDIRSMGTHHMGVFYDGIQLGNAQNGQIDLGKFSLDNIEEISLYNGQKSEIFQPAKDFGSAGTIYLRSRTPKFKAGKNTNLQAIFRTGSFGLLNPSVLWEQKITDRISSSVNAEYVAATGKYKFRYRKVFPDGTVAWDTTAVRQNGDIHSLRLEGALNGYSDLGKWNAKVYYYDSERGIPGAIVNNVWKNSQRQWDRNFFAQGNYTMRPANKYELQVNAKYARDEMRYLNPDTTLMYIDNSFLQHELYLSFANKYQILSWWDVALSADYQFNTLYSDLTGFVFPKRNTLLVALATAVEWNKIKAQASLLSSFVADRVTLPSDNADSQSGTNNTRSDQEFTPAVFFSYKPFTYHALSINAFYKRIFRMPTFNDLYYTDIGNTSLLPEYTTQYNLGIAYSKAFQNSFVDNISVKTDAYYNQITDKIIAVPKGNGQYRWMMMNLGYVEIRGVDFSGKVECNLPAGIKLQTGLNYTYQQAQDFSDPEDNDPVFGSYGSQIAYIPWHSGSVTARFLYKLWELNYSFIYVGERYHNSSNIRANREQPWYTHDLTFARTFRLKHCGLRFAAELNNVFDQQYDVILNYPMPGRNIKIIAKIEL